MFSTILCMHISVSLPNFCGCFCCFFLVSPLIWREMEDGVGLNPSKISSQKSPSGNWGEEAMVGYWELKGHLLMTVLLHLSLEPMNYNVKEQQDLPKLYVFLASIYINQYSTKAFCLLSNHLRTFTVLCFILACGLWHFTLMAPGAMKIADS